MRMHIRRFTRLCNGFSKKLENHRAAAALHFAWYNFCRIHESLRVTPAMEAGLTTHVWGLEELTTKVLDEPCGARPIFDRADVEVPDEPVMQSVAALPDASQQGEDGGLAHPG